MVGRVRFDFKGHLISVHGMQWSQLGLVAAVCVWRLVSHTARWGHRRDDPSDRPRAEKLLLTPTCYGLMTSWGSCFLATFSSKVKIFPFITVPGIQGLKEWGRGLRDCGILHRASLFIMSARNFSSIFFSCSTAELFLLHNYSGGIYNLHVGFLETELEQQQLTSCQRIPFSPSFHIGLFIRQDLSFISKQYLLKSSQQHQTATDHTITSHRQDKKG